MLLLIVVVLSQENEAITVCFLKGWVLVLPEEHLHHFSEKDFATLRFVFAGLGGLAVLANTLVLLCHQSKYRFGSIE